MENFAKIKLAVNHGNLILVKNLPVTNYAVNSINVEFEFRTDEWDNLTKTVVFSRAGTTSKLVLLKDGETSCHIPWEILYFDNQCNSDNVFEIGVLGIGANGERLPTTALQLRVKRGCYIPGETPEDPTPDIFEELAAMLQQHITKDEINEIVQKYVEAVASRFDPVGSADAALTEAKAYTDEKVETLEESLPTKVSDLNNDSGFLTIEDLPPQCRMTMISLPVANWVGDISPYSQVVDVPNIVSNHKIDLQPTALQITQLQDEEIALTTENNDGVVTVYAIGSKPTTDYTIQAIITEVIIE